MIKRNTIKLVFLLISIILLGSPASAEDQKYVMAFNEGGVNLLKTYLGSKYTNKRIKELVLMLLTNNGVEVPAFANTFEIENVNSYANLVQELNITSAIQKNSTLKIFRNANDTYMTQQWGLNNVGQSNGVNNIDVNAPEAWDITTGSNSIVVAVIDSGIQRNHSDLSSNIYINTAEANGVAGVDDDNNGLIDDINGYNFISNNNNINDDNGHGTYVSGVIGAKANNSNGVAGINWNVKILPLKVMDSNGEGSISDVSRAVDYVVDLKRRGVNIVAINASFGGSGYVDALFTSVKNASDAGIAFIAAAGNDSSNNDQTATYPANFNIRNLISVAAVDRRGNLWSNSNYGATKVHIAAPGLDIITTSPNNSYSSATGTSLAAPFVTGAVALASSANTSTSIDTIVSRIKNRTFSKSLNSLTNKVSTGGMLDLNALVRADSGNTNVNPPAKVTVTSPIHNSTSNNRLPSFSWTNVNANKYEIWVNNITTGQSKVIYNQNLTQTTYNSSIQLSPARYVVWVRGVNQSGSVTKPGDWSDSVAFTIETASNPLQTPSITSPTGTTTDTTPQITWSAVQGATKYDLWINNITTGVGQVVRQQNLTTNRFQTTTALSAGTYAAWVQAYRGSEKSAWSNEARFEIVNNTNTVKPGKPSITAPSANSETEDLTPTLSWSSASNASSYEIWANKRISGNSWESKVISRNVNQTSYTPQSDLRPGEYRLWIRAFNSSGLAGDWSDGRDFTILAPMTNSSGIPEFSSPTVSSGDDTPTFTWTRLTSHNGKSIVGYQLWVNSVKADGTNGNILINKDVSSNSYTHTSPFPYGNYRAWIRVKFSDGTYWHWNAQAYEFTITGSLSSTTILTPATNTSTTDKTPTLTWQRVTGAENYEILARDLTRSATHVFATTNNSTTFDIPQPLEKGVYRFWIRAKATGFTPGNWGVSITLNIM